MQLRTYFTATATTGIQRVATPDILISQRKLIPIPC